MIPAVIIAAIPQITAMASTLIATISKASIAVQAFVTKLPMLIEKIKPIADTLFKAMEVMDELKNIQSARELGEKTLSTAHSKTDFESGDISKNVKDIEKTTVDPEVIKEVSDEDIHAVATSLMISVLESKYGPCAEDLVTLIARSPVFFNSERLGMYLTLCDNTGLTVKDISDYFSSNLDRKDVAKVEDLLMQAEGDLQQDEVVSILKNVRQERE
ncbi:hypothetical protein [Moritella sp. Urea-trap-13]|uniref:hypothetical protein n=1 Tax=Moritella sp. Urea-trap-13 TaxID=2058327 RepID=UPI000C3362A5|nr:hypothetical protein [Moritella sp. Urea-trap-13]PKH07130.1 hypothetical protein CXF93_14785 [Moritella sp. Urea-trap-13]